MALAFVEAVTCPSLGGLKQTAIFSLSYQSVLVKCVSAERAAPKKFPLNKDNILIHCHGYYDP